MKVISHSWKRQGLTLLDFEDPQGFHQATRLAPQSVFRRVKCSLQPGWARRVLSVLWAGLDTNQNAYLSCMRSLLPFSRPLISAYTCVSDIRIGKLDRLTQGICTHDSAVFSLAIDIVHLCDEALARDGGVEDVVEVDGQDAEESFLAGGGLRSRRLVSSHVCIRFRQNVQLYMWYP